MATKSEKARELLRKASAQGMIDNAPSRGGRGTFMKLPEGVKFFNPKAGRTYRLVFLPWVAGKGNKAAKEGEVATNHFLFIHKGVGANEESYLCPSASSGKKCPQCEEFFRLKGKSEWDDIKDLRPKHREFFVIHDLDGEKDNIQVWEESVVLFGDYLRDKIARKKSLQNYASLDDGKIVEVAGKEKKIGKNSCTEYVNIDIEDREEPLSEKLIDKLLALPCPDSWVFEIPYDKFAKLVGQTPGSEEEEEAEESETEEEESEEEIEEPETEEEDETEEEIEESEEEEPETEEDEESEEESEEEEETEEAIDDEEEISDNEDEVEEEEPKPKKKLKTAEKPQKKKTGKK